MAQRLVSDLQTDLCHTVESDFTCSVKGQDIFRPFSKVLILCGDFV